MLSSNFPRASIDLPPNIELDNTTFDPSGFNWEIMNNININNLYLANLYYVDATIQLTGDGE